MRTAQTRTCECACSDSFTTTNRILSGRSTGLQLCETVLISISRRTCCDEMASCSSFTPKRTLSGRSTTRPAGMPHGACPERPRRHPGIEEAHTDIQLRSPTNPPSTLQVSSPPPCTPPPDRVPACLPGPARTAQAMAPGPLAARSVAPPPWPLLCPGRCAPGAERRGRGRPSSPQRHAIAAARPAPHEAPGSGVLARPCTRAAAGALAPGGLLCRDDALLLLHPPLRLGRSGGGVVAAGA